ncbi:MAG: bifunctional ornithine acetyltransferase/N-acetylglutamate synthase, partial [Burkholderiaceae bacterium]|nr:bifunctional ornithine acetyltransferase/N-acetylglutamate synthase [Burkholderiaceae bacterium]
MPVRLPPPDRASLLPVAGVSLCAVSAGIRKAGRTDLLLIGLAPGTTVAGVFTQNAFCAAPVQVCRMHLASAQAIRALVINTGCANAGTGRQGLADAHKTCQRVAEA